MRHETAIRPKLSILTLNFNRVSETRNTVERLFSVCADRADVEIIAVDNGSVDGTGDYLQSVSDRLMPVRMPENLGIEGINIGSQAARGKYLMILDDDSYPADAETLNRAAAWLDEHPETGVVACRIFRADGTPFAAWHYPDADRPVDSMAFVGCGFVIRRELFAAIGGYPADFFLYQNEIEVAIQVWLAGYRVTFLPECRVIHREAPGGRTNWRRVFFPTRNTLWIIRRYFPFPASIHMALTRTAIGLLRTIQSGEFRWYAKSVFAGLCRPINKTLLPRSIRRRFAPFCQQNDLRYWIGRFLRSSDKPLQK